MAVTVERLIATLEARFDSYEKSLDRALGNTNRKFSAIERRGKQLEQRMTAIGSGIGRNLLGAFAAGVSLRGAQQLIDSATKIQNALKVAGLEGEDLSKVYDQLFASAQRNAAPLEALVQLYSRVALVQEELGVSSAQIATLTDNVGKALRLTGGDAASASGALLQLGQALGANKIQAEEYNSLIDGMPGILQAAAAGIKEAGGSVARLTELVKSGEVSNKAFFDGIEAGAYVLDDKLAGAELTVSQAFVRLQNVLIDTAGELDEGSDASGRMAEALESLSDWIQNTDFSPLINGVMDFAGSVKTAVEWLTTLATQANQLGLEWGAKLGTDRIGKSILGEIDDAVSQDRIQGRISGAHSADAKGDRRPTEVTVTEPRRTISLNDERYRVSDSGKKGGGGRSRKDEYQREIEQIQERTAAIQAETAAMAGLNPLVSDYGYAMEKARAVQDLLNAAKQAGIEITPALRASIEELAEGYANASVEAEKLAEKQDKARQAAEDMRELGKDVLGGFINDIRNGTSAAEALQNALNKVLDRLIEISLQNLFSGIGGAGGKGLLGGLIIPGILHSGGVAGRDGYGHGRAVSPSTFASARRYHTGGIAGLRAGEVPAILQRGEVVIPRGGFREGSGSTNVTINAPINAPGADPAQLRRVQESVTLLGKSVPKIVDQRSKTAQMRGTRA